MFGAMSVSSTLTTHLEELFGPLGGVLNGSEEAIHDARVAIRRTYETLALIRAAASRADVDEFDESLRRLSRALSRARDADVMSHLLRHANTRLRLPSSLLDRLDSRIRDEQMKARRRAVKTVEKVDIRSHAAAAAASAARVDLRRARSTLRGQVASRAEVLRDAVERAGTMYFPNRLHSARLHMKRLRYAIELADRLNVPRPRRALRTLRQGQELLGELHDHQLLLERVIDSASREDEESLDAVRRFVMADIEEVHPRYVSKRSEILGVCDRCLVTGRSHVGLKLLVAAGVAANSVIVLRRLARRAGTGSTGRSLTAVPSPSRAS
jgi:CHAD domain-containing protein